MLRMCRPIFGIAKAVVLDIVFCVAKGSTKIESKGVYVEALIKRRHYWPKLVTGDLIDNHFQDKEVSDLGMLESRTQENKTF